MTIFSSTEPKFVLFLQKSHGKILFSTRQTQFYISLVCFSRGLFVSARAVSAPSHSKTKNGSVQSVFQCRTHFCFSKLVKVIGFRDFFRGGGGGGGGGAGG